MIKKNFKCICLLNLLLIYTVNAVAADRSPKIIGGRVADNWPWMAALVYSNGSTSAFCGGSLVAPNWILTAAHCVVDDLASGGYLPTDVTVFDVLINRPLLRSNGGERIRPAQVVIHPGYDNKSFSNDIALVRLSASSSVQPIETLPDFSALDESGQNNAIALGWGNTSATGKRFPNDLRQVEMPIITNEVCRRSMDGIEDNMLCAGAPQGGLDTCEGDSGGPLIVFDRERNAWRQAAITSFGEGDCATAGYYGVYTRLDHYKAFITQTICDPNQIPPTPTLNILTSGTTVTATWTMSNAANGYRLNWAPYPSLFPIQSAELNFSGSLTVTLPHNSAYYVAVNAYNNNCRSGFSNIEHFVVP